MSVINAYDNYKNGVENVVINTNIEMIFIPEYTEEPEINQINLADSNYQVN